MTVLFSMFFGLRPFWSLLYQEDSIRTSFTNCLLSFLEFFHLRTHIRDLINLCFNSDLLTLNTNISYRLTVSELIYVCIKCINFGGPKPYCLFSLHLCNKEVRYLQVSYFTFDFELTFVWRFALSDIWFF